MRVSFIVNPVYINNGWSPWDKRLGGSEECVVEWSKRLSDMGHKVNVYHNGRHGKYMGANYLPHSEYEPGDITINVNYPQFKPQGKTIYSTSLDDNPDVSMFDAVCVISKYAKRNTGIKHDKIHIVSPGYDSDYIYPDTKVKKQCLYASSPDRGLMDLLRLWPLVLSEHPDATLKVTYDAPPYEYPGVEFLGEVDNMEMNLLYRESDIWAYPCNGVELYCMTGVKAQAAGCIPVIIPHMALAETVKYGYFSDIENYADTLIMALDRNNDHMADKALEYDWCDWEDSTNKLLTVIRATI